MAERPVEEYRDDYHDVAGFNIVDPAADARDVIHEENRILAERNPGRALFVRWRLWCRFRCQWLARTPLRPAAFFRVAFRRPRLGA